MILDTNVLLRALDGRTDSQAQAIVAEPAFDVEHGEALVDAATVYRTRSIDLHDCFLAAIADQRGSRVLSFDADLRRLGVVEEP